MADPRVSAPTAAKLAGLDWKKLTKDERAAVTAVTRSLNLRFEGATAKMALRNFDLATRLEEVRDVVWGGGFSPAGRVLLVRRIVKRNP